MKKFNYTFILFALMCFLLPNAVCAQNVLIPDSLFKNALLNHNPVIDSNFDGEIQVTEALNFTDRIQVGNLGISDVTGIEAFRNLKIFRCYYNQISNIDVSQNDSLVIFECRFNLLNQIDVSNNLLLQTLDVGNNQISTIDVSNNPRLERLYLNDNQLGSIGIANNSSLTHFDIAQNQLTQIDFSNQNSLEFININNNQIPDFNIFLFPSVPRINCAGNPLIWPIDVSNNANLLALDVSNLGLTDLDISNNPLLYSLSCSNNQLTSLDLSNQPLLSSLACNNNLITTLDLANKPQLKTVQCAYNNLVSLHLFANNVHQIKCNNNSNLSSLRIESADFLLPLLSNISNNPNLFCVEIPDSASAAWIFSTWSSYPDSLDPQTQIRYRCFYTGYNSISGTVVADSNCIIDSIDARMAGVIIKSTPGNYYGMTDSVGSYAMIVDSGIVEIEQVFSGATSPLIQVICPVSESHVLHFDSNYSDTSNLNFHNKIIACPVLTVDLASNRRRRCFNSHTSISYSNEGFAEAQNVKVYVQLPSYVHLVSANTSYTVNNSGIYEFDIGAVKAGFSGEIQLVDSVACENGITGLTQCTKAWITPTNDCLNDLDTTSGVNAGWDRSSILVSGVCLGDSIVQFSIINTGDAGTGDMQSSSTYRIYIDNVLTNTVSFQLNGNDTLSLNIMANGATVRLEADQHPAHPGNSHPNTSIEGCGTNSSGTFSSGLINTSPLNNEDIQMAEECLPIIDSYDPNDKAVSPSGIFDGNYVHPQSLLHYKIRFQNTGTDTAYKVIVIDTLPIELDIATLEFGSSSHPYQIHVSGKERPVLSFIFNNINLVDSLTDELNSQGYLSFSASAKSNVVEKSEVHNFAEIYFDYNLPITTNDAWVTLYDSVRTGSEIPVNVGISSQIEASQIRVYPNPVQDQLFIEINGSNSYTQSTFSLFDLTGKMLLTKNIDSGLNYVELNKIASGLYFYSISSGQLQLKTGKLSIE